MEKTQTIEIGMRIYNRGDQMNVDRWATVTAIAPCRWYGLKIELTTDAEDDLPVKVYTVPVHCIDHVDKGHGGTRIVTEAAYRKREAEQIAAFYTRFPHLAAQNA